MTNLKREKVGQLCLDSLVGASFFSGEVKNKLLATITDVFKNKDTGEITLGVNYPSTGSYDRCPLKDCRNYPLVSPEEVERYTKGRKGYSE